MDDSIVPMGIDALEVVVVSIIVATEIASVGAVVVPVVVPDDHFVAADVLMIPNIGDPPFTGEARRGTTG